MNFAYITIKKDKKNIPALYSAENNLYYPINDLYLSRKNFANITDFIETHTKEDIKKISVLYKNNFLNIKKSYSPEEIKLLSPIENTVHDILCVGLNYLEHTVEYKGNAKEDKQKVPIFFSKRAKTIIGNGGYIDCLKYTDTLDYECELAVIISKTCKDVKKEKVEDVIFGYTVFNDITSREGQRIYGQWFKGKSYDNMSAMGPYIVHKSALKYPFEIELKTTINGVIAQHSNTKNIIFDIPTIISELSQGMTLYACDIISTGTPKNILDNHTFLKKGDVVECYIEKVGTLKNIIK